MAQKPQILAFAGSARKDSLNKKLVRIAAEAARQAGANVSLIDLKDFPLPLFDEDLEVAEGPPENVIKLKKLMVEHNGLLISSPEYNSSISGVLKNAIDWVSRPAEGEPPLVAFAGKVAALLSASPGSLGGLRGLVHVRAILGNIRVIVLPDQVAIPAAFQAFDGDDALKDKGHQAKVEELGKTLADTLAKLRA